MEAAFNENESSYPLKLTMKIFWNLYVQFFRKLTSQKMKSSIKEFLRKCDQIDNKLRKEFLVENFILWTVPLSPQLLRIYKFIETMFELHRRYL